MWILTMYIVENIKRLRVDNFHAISSHIFRTTLIQAASPFFMMAVCMSFDLWLTAHLIKAVALWNHSCLSLSLDHSWPTYKYVHIVLFSLSFSRVQHCNSCKWYSLFSCSNLPSVDLLWSDLLYQIKKIDFVMALWLIWSIIQFIFQTYQIFINSLCASGCLCLSSNFVTPAPIKRFW